VWIDFVEGVSYADDFFFRIIANEDVVLVSQLISKEFFRYADYNFIASLLALLDSKDLIEHVSTYKFQEDEAELLAEGRDVPRPDALHAVLARDNNSILVTKDKHFLSLKDVCSINLL
jgi:predicted nucleic acid-binding protein